MKRYLNMMIESLEKKLAVLEEIQEANVQQSALLKAEPFDQEAFDRTMDVKGEQIEKLDSLDEGFDNLYQQVRDLLPAHKEEFHDEIAGMQDLIRKISEKSVSIQVGEQRNKAALLCVIIWIIVPQFITSIRDFGDNIMLYYNNVMKFLNSSRGEQILKFLEDNDINPAMLRTKLMSLTTYIPDAVGTLSTWASGLIGGVIDFFIGLIFSVYVLAARNKLRSQGRQILRHFLPEKHYHRLSHYGRLTFSTFSNFISGQLSDAFILGVLIFCVMSIGGLEYPMMIAVIIGITNMIPYVGPWMGTIPCALILLMVNPGHAIAFVIIVIIAQQIDSNLIYPRVVGTSVGLPAIWVLFAITVGGGLFGVLGMIVGVPVMSIIYTVMREKTASGTPNQPSQPEKKKHRWHIRQSVQTLYSRAAKRKNSENDHSDSAK